MSKWRPSEECLYVIPDIHGQLYQLELILSRILPLRKRNGFRDKIIFLGDYVDRGSYSPDVIDKLVDLKEKYNDQVVCLIGNHELMFMDAIGNSESSDDYLIWMQNGGYNTLVSYLDRANYKLDNPYVLDRRRVKDFIPLKHIEFIKKLQPYYETDDFIFVHGGCDPYTKLSEQDPKTLVWDRSLFNKIVKNPYFDYEWEKCIITGHNCYSKAPLITPKFMMLDSSCNNELIVIELNSMEGFVAEKGNKKMNKLIF